MFQITSSDRVLAPLARFAVLLSLASAPIATHAAEETGYTVPVTFALRNGWGGYCDFFASPSCERVDEGLRPLYPYSPVHSEYIWVFVGNVPDGEGPGTPGGVGGIRFGIEYPEELGITSWTLCTGGAEIPQADEGGTWPDSGTGNAVTFSGGCYDPVIKDELALVGVFTYTAQTDGYLRIVDDPRFGKVEVNDCALTYSEPCDEALGWVGLRHDGPVGYNPCGVECAVPVAEASWSRLKTLY